MGTCRVEGLRFRVYGFDFRVQGLGSRVYVSGSSVQGTRGLSVHGKNFSVLGF